MQAVTKPSDVSPLAKLKSLPHWVVWRLETRKGKPTKVPYSPHGTGRASSTDPETWGTYEEAQERLRTAKTFQYRLDGIGFVFAEDDPFCGVDLDGCVDAGTGEMEPWAAEIVEDLDSYAELSPSGTGVHVILEGSLSMGRNRKGNIEMYDRGRFLTVTERPINGRAVSKRPKALRRLQEETFGAKPEKSQKTGAATPIFSSLTDDEVVWRASGAQNGEKFRRLWEGDRGGYDSASEADLALCSMLAFWTGPDPDRIASLFAASGLSRGKWERPDYRRKTIGRALEDASFYAEARLLLGKDEGGGAAVQAETNGAVPARVPGVATLATLTLAELVGKEFPPVRWVVPDLIPQGTMLLAGKPKMGKSWMALGLCVAVAGGGLAFGDKGVEEGDVLYLALEDNERRLKDRSLKVLGGQTASPRLHMATASTRLDQGFVQTLENWLQGYPEARLIVVDTMAKIRSRTTDRRTLYEQDYEVGSDLTTLAGKHNVAIILVHHLKKGDADDALDLISGSTGLSGGVDGAMVLTRTRSEADAVLKVVHRDLKDDRELALRWDSDVAAWNILGSAEEYRLSKERREILDVLANSDEPLRPKEIAEVLDKLTPNVTKMLQLMREDGQVDNASYGKYMISHAAPSPVRLRTPNTVHSVHNVHTSTSGSTMNDTKGMNGFLAEESEEF